MQLEITGRHIEITPALREFTEEKLGKLARLLDGPLEVHVVLGIEKHRHLAEVQVKSKYAVFAGAQETGDLYASIGEVADKLERQVLKHKEKMRTRKVKRGPRRPEAAAEMEAKASPAGPGDGNERPRRTQPSVAARRYRVKPLSPEDAMLELESTKGDVLVYRDAQTDRVGVVYRQKDGSLALIEPEY
ncbi:MAG TPA: ribosome-associated translation inhibitor RaiA [Candidatus Polarisedimenticolaceae bacterium]|nr:ribosome-associated translation inhibitor RaiA [Candidatus Polarisedimenticolaceae bacterium]